ncbi:hypothetical protein DL98DRAFT_626994 [Cadophora sp. DSE1049]|nr:hypothetical protein DL98DRAFT_626994 [Cadophora sp. DSE1049]
MQPVEDDVMEEPLFIGVSSRPDEFVTSGSSPEEFPSPPSGNVMLRPNEKATYVGATHWAAILEDIEEAKSYFEEAEETMGDEDIKSYSSLAFNAATPSTKPDLMAALPPRLVIDRFVSRYFNSNSPSLRDVSQRSVSSTSVWFVIFLLK